MSADPFHRWFHEVFPVVKAQVDEQWDSIPADPERDKMFREKFSEAVHSEEFVKKVGVQGLHRTRSTVGMTAAVGQASAEALKNGSGSQLHERVVLVDASKSLNVDFRQVGGQSQAPERLNHKHASYLSIITGGIQQVGEVLRSPACQLLMMALVIIGLQIPLPRVAKIALLVAGNLLMLPVIYSLLINKKAASK